MVFRKKTTVRRKRRPTLARKVQKLTRVVRTIKPELKFQHSSYSTSVGSTPTLMHLSAVTQGDGRDNRDGNIIRSLYMKMRLLATSSAVSNIFRITVFKWNSTTAPTYLDIINTNSPLSSYNRYSPFYKILYNKIVHIPYDSAAQSYLVQKTVSFKNQLTKFDGTASTDIQSGQIYVMVQGDSVINTTSYDLYLDYFFHDV